MADYFINVKAKLDVKEFESDVNSTIKSKPIPVELKPTVIFDPGNTNVAALRNGVDNYFKSNKITVFFSPADEIVSQKDMDKINGRIDKIKPNPINIKTGIDAEDYQKFTDDINNIKKAVKELSKQTIDIGLGFDKEDIASLSTDIKALVKLYDTFNDYGIDMGLRFDREDIESLKSEVQTLVKLYDTFNNADISIGFNTEDIETLNKNIDALSTLYQDIKRNPLDIRIDMDEEKISALKTDIENYFKEHPIKLTVSEDTDGINLKALTEAWQEYAKTAKTLNADILQNQRDAIKLQAYALQEQYKANQLTIEEYYQKLKQLRDDDNNNAILLAKGSSATKIEIEKQLVQAEIALENEKAEKVKEARQSITDSLTSQTQNALNDFTEKANALINNTESIRKSSEEYKNLIAVVDEYVQSLENVRANYKNGLIDGEEFRKQITEAFVDSVNIENLPEEMKEKIGGFFSETLNKLAEDFKNSFTTSRDVVSEFYNTLSEGQTFFNQFDDEFKEFGKVTLNDFYDKISVFKNFAEKIGFEKLSKNIQDITKDVEDFVKNKDAEQSLEFYKTQFNELHDRILKVEEAFKNYNQELSDTSITEEEAHKKLTGLINEIKEISLVYDELKKAISFEEIKDNLDNFQSDSVDTFTELGQEIRKMSELAEEGIFPVDALGNKTYRIKQLIQELQEYTTQALNEENKARQVLYEQDAINRREVFDKTIQESTDRYVDAETRKRQELETTTQQTLEANKKILDDKTEVNKKLLDDASKTAQETVNIAEESEKKVQDILTGQDFNDKANQWKAEIQNTISEFGKFNLTVLEAKKKLEELRDAGLQTFGPENADVIIQNYEDALKQLPKAREQFTKETEAAFKEQTQLLILDYKNKGEDFDKFVKELQEKIEKAKKEGIVSEKTIKETELQLKKLQEAYNKSLQKIEDDKEKARQKDLEENRKSIQTELSDTQDLYNKKLISAEEYVNRMNSILPRAFEAGVDGAQKFQNSVTKVSKELQEAKNKTDSFSDSLNRFGNSSDRIFNSLMRYFGVTQVISAVTNSFSKMVTEVRNLDIELTEFKKVSDLTDEGLQKFINDSYELGSTVAKTGTEVVTATTLFKKMGYEVDKSMQFAKDALMWTNVADGMVSVEEASTMLISTMKAFGEESISTTHIIDALNEVSNNYSVSSSDLSNNLSTVAATLAASGVEFEEMLGLMTAGIEVMPDKASKVANGLKTISQRIRQIEGDTADKLDEFLGARGIERFDKTTNQLKSTYDILSEISELWPKLSINERQYLGEVMAGKNQITVLNAIMTNFKTTLNATATAYASLGSAEKENERVMESIEGHIKEFKSAFSKLSKDIISSDVIKDVVDFGTKILEWLDDIVKNRGPLLIKTITSIGTALASLKLVQFTQSIPNIIASLGKIDPLLASITVGVSAITFVISEFVQEEEKANQAAEKSKEIVDEYFKRQKNTADEAQKSIKDLIGEYEKLSKELLSTQDREERNGILDQLQKVENQLKNQNISVDLINGSYEEQIRLLKEALVTQKELALEEHKRAYKKQQLDFNPVADVASKNFDTDYTLGKDGLFGNAFKSDEQKIEEATKNINNIVVDGIKKTKETLTNGQKAITEINGRTLEEVLNDSTLSKEQQIKILEGAVIRYNNFAEQAGLAAQRASVLIARGIESGDTTLENTSTVAKETFETQETVFKNQAAGIAQVLDSMRENAKESEDILTEQQEVVSAKLDAMDISLKDLSSSSLLELQQIIEEIDIEGELDISNLPPEYQEFANILSNVDERSALLVLTTNALKIATANEGQAMEDASNSTDGLNDSGKKLKLTLSGAMAKMEEYSQKAQILAQAQEDITNTGQITSETLKKIVDAGLEAYLIYDEDTKSLVVNTQALNDNLQVLEDEIIAQYVSGQNTKFNAEIKDVLSGSSDNSASSLDKETSAINENTDATLDNAVALSQENAELMEQLELEGKLTDAQKEAIKAKTEAYKTETKVGIEALRSYLHGSTATRTATSRGASHSSSGGSSSSSSSSATNRAAEQAQREAEQAIKDAQNAWKDAFEIEYKKLKTYLDAELITYEEYYDALEALNEQYFAGRSEFEEEYWKYQDEVVKGRKKYLEDELKDYFTKGEKILKHQLNVEYITEEEYYDALTLLYETYYTDKEKYEEEYWKLEEEIYKLRQKQIKELEDELKDLYKEIEDLHKEYINSLKDDADDIKDIVSYATDIIDDEIAKLKEQKKAIDESNEALEEQLKLQELEENLEKAKQKKIRVYRKGQGFVYEQDTKAVNEAQTALDEYKKELQHKKQLSMIDEEITKWEQYKKEWKSVTDVYKISQGEMTAQAIIGENAREKVLAREYAIVGEVAKKYESVQESIEKANNATIENLEEYIGDEATAGTFSYEIKRIKDKIAEIEDKTVTLQVQTSNSGSNIQNVINQITTLKEKLEQTYSTNNIDTWASHYISQINSISQASARAGVTLPNYSGSGDYNYNYNPGSSYSSTGWSPGTKVKINSTGKENWPSNWLYKDNNYTVVQDDTNNPGNVLILVEGGTGGNVTHTVPASWLMGINDTDYTDYSESSSSYNDDVYDSSSSSRYPYNEQVSYGGKQYIRTWTSEYQYSDSPLFASGTTGTTTRNFLVNEEGLEAMVTPEGTVISAPALGYGVIKNQYTERLTDFAADPMAFLYKEFSGYSGNYKNNTSNNETININGNLTLPNVTDGESFIDSIRSVALQYTTRRS